MQCAHMEHAPNVVEGNVPVPRGREGLRKTAEHQPASEAVWISCCSSLGTVRLRFEARMCFSHIREQGERGLAVRSQGACSQRRWAV